MSATPSPNSPRPLARSQALAILAGGVAVLVSLGGLWAWWAGRPAPAPPDDGPAAAIDPRLSYPTPYKNVRPEVKYVGDAVCAECHAKESESYAHHPMGR